jgi:hypothetical protein
MHQNLAEELHRYCVLKVTWLSHRTWKGVAVPCERGAANATHMYSFPKAALVLLCCGDHAQIACLV